MTGSCVRQRRYQLRNSHLTEQPADAAEQCPGQQPSIVEYLDLADVRRGEPGERMRRLAHRDRAGSKRDVLMVNVHVRYWRVVVGGDVEFGDPPGRDHWLVRVTRWQRQRDRRRQ